MPRGHSAALATHPERATLAARAKSTSRSPSQGPALRYSHPGLTVQPTGGVGGEVLLLNSTASYYPLKRATRALWTRWR